MREPSLVLAKRGESFRGIFSTPFPVAIRPVPLSGFPRARERAVEASWVRENRESTVPFPLPRRCFDHRSPAMSEILDQSDLTGRAARLVEAAKKAGADAADAVCVRGVALSMDVRLGKIEETQRAEGDDFTLRVFVGKRSAVVSANVVADPAELAERDVAMARVAREDKYAGLG